LNDPKPNNFNNNPLELVIGTKLFGQQQHFPYQQQPNTNVMNILDMAAKGAISSQNNAGWPQSPQQPNQWNQPQQNQEWGKSNQPNNSWQTNNNKPNNGWGNGW
jgi:hypothetical protein